jgi:hypothetical protein
VKDERRDRFDADGKFIDKQRSLSANGGESSSRVGISCEQSVLSL